MDSTASTAERIRNQVEFYFSDSNLLKDRFMRQRLEADPDGYIDVAVLLSFNRLAALSSDAAAVASALSTSAALELTGDGTRVRRRAPLPEHVNVDDRTIYIESLPTDADHDSLRRHFERFGRVEYVSIPRFKHNRQPKGFAFVEFGTPEESQRALADLSTPSPDATTSMRGMSKIEWLRLKAEYKQLQRESAARAKDAAAHREKGPPVPSERIDGVIAEFRHVRGDASKAELKALFERHAPVAFVDHRPGQTMGFVRFVTPAGASLACAQFDGCAEPGAQESPDKGITLTLLEGELERQYWERVADYKAARKEKTRRQRDKRAGGATAHPPARVPECAENAPLKGAADQRPKQQKKKESRANAPRKESTTAAQSHVRTHMRFDDSEDDNTPALNESKRPREDEADPADRAKRQRVDEQ